MRSRAQVCCASRTPAARRRTCAATHAQAFALPCSVGRVRGPGLEGPRDPCHQGVQQGLPGRCVCEHSTAATTTSASSLGAGCCIAMRDLKSPWPINYRGRFVMACPIHSWFIAAWPTHQQLITDKMPDAVVVHRGVSDGSGTPGAQPVPQGVGDKGSPWERPDLGNIPLTGLQCTYKTPKKRFIGPPALSAL